MTHIKKMPVRPSAAEVEALAKFSPATIHEAQGRRGALSSRIKPVDYRMKLCGPAFTVRCAPRKSLFLDGPGWIRTSDQRIMSQPPPCSH